MPITLRIPKGSELTYEEMDENFSYLEDEANKIDGITVDNTTLADGRIIQYDGVSNTHRFIDIPESGIQDSAELSQTFTTNEHVNIPLATNLLNPSVIVTKDAVVNTEIFAFRDTGSYTTVNIEQEAYSIALQDFTPDGTTGTITVVSTGTYFNDSMVGLLLAINGGECVITERVDSSTIICFVTAELNNINTALAGEWHFRRAVINNEAIRLPESEAIGDGSFVQSNITTVGYYQRIAISPFSNGTYLGAYLVGSTPHYTLLDANLVPFGNAVVMDGGSRAPISKPLKNGNVVLAWESGNIAKFMIVDETGAIVVATTSIGSCKHNDAPMYLCPLSDGGFVFSTANHSTGAINYAVFNADGSVRRVVTEPNTDSCRTTCSCELASGNILIAYENLTLGGCYSLVIDTLGNITRTAVQITTLASYNFSRQLHVFGYANGNIFFGITPPSGTSSFMLIAEDGSIITALTAVQSTINTAFYADGYDSVVVYDDKKNNDIITSAGMILPQPDFSTLTVGVGRGFTMPNGNAVIVFMDFTSRYTTAYEKATGLAVAVGINEFGVSFLNNIDTTALTALIKFTVEAEENNQEVLLAFSTDNLTWSIMDETGGVRNIVQKPSTWQFNDGANYATDTWVETSTIQSQQTLTLALMTAVEQNANNRMTPAMLNAVVTPTSFIPLASSLSVAVLLRSNNALESPKFNRLSARVTADGQAGAILGTDYSYTKQNDSYIEFTSLIDSNMNIRII